MENYTLQPNESILYKNDCRLSNRSGELILTNLYLVLITKTKKLFAKEEVQIEIHPIEEIKIYNDIPQIKQNDSYVEVFFTNETKSIDLFTKSEVRKFMNTAFELLTGKTMSTRISEKVKNAVGLVDDTLGINTVGTIKNVAENGLVGTVLGGFKKKSRAKSTRAHVLTEVLSVSNDLNTETHSQKPKTESIENQIETLKKLKELLDAGIISQDEFDIKKKQILSL